MTSRAPRMCLCALAMLLTAAAPARLGFVNLPRLVAMHPLYDVLREYDREIAALSETQKIAGLSDAAPKATGAAASARREAGAAEEHAQQSIDRSREQRALAAIFTSRRGGDGGVNAFGGELSRATDASLSAYERAMAARNARAYSARAQELREKELTLAFDLARANSGRRLSLRLKLAELHLSPAARAQLARQLTALDSAAQRAVAAMRRADAGVLAAYRSELDHNAATEVAAMSAQLQRNAAANFATRQRVAQTGGANASPQLSARAAAFRASAASRSQDIRSGFKAAGADLSQRFGTLAAADAGSARQTAAEIRALAATRASLYRSIVTEIGRDAEEEARQRHLAGVRLAGENQTAQVDLTAAVAAELNSARR